MSEERVNQPSERLYKIQNDIYNYFTGHLDNGNQVLMNSVGTSSSGVETETPTFPLVEFDKDGNLLAIYDEETGPPCSPMRFTPGTICVKQFFMHDPRWLNGIGITDLPEHYQEFLDHPESVAEDDRVCYREEIEEWLTSGEFVLWFNEDYYLNEEGELDSS